MADGARLRLGDRRGPAEGRTKAEWAAGRVQRFTLGASFPGGCLRPGGEGAGRRDGLRAPVPAREPPEIHLL